MLKNIKIGIFATLAIFALVSCGGESADTADSAREAVTTPQQPTTPAATTAQTPPAQNAAPVGPTTVMQFAETEFNFGTVTAGEKVSHTYSFKNTGNEPLIISNAKGSCGCTVPAWPREPIPVGGSGEITVQFDSKNKKGQRNQKVTITANTDPPQTFIYLKGEVAPGEAAPAVNVTQ